MTEEVGKLVYSEKSPQVATQNLSSEHQWKNLKQQVTKTNTQKVSQLYLLQKYTKAHYILFFGGGAILKSAEFRNEISLVSHY